MKTKPQVINNAPSPAQAARHFRSRAGEYLLAAEILDPAPKPLRRTGPRRLVPRFHVTHVHTIKITRIG